MAYGYEKAGYVTDVGSLEVAHDYNLWRHRRVGNSRSTGEFVATTEGHLQGSISTIQKSTNRFFMFGIFCVWTHLAHMTCVTLSWSSSAYHGSTRQLACSLMHPPGQDNIHTISSGAMLYTTMKDVPHSD